MSQLAAHDIQIFVHAPGMTHPWTRPAHEALDRARYTFEAINPAARALVLGVMVAAVPPGEDVKVYSSLEMGAVSLAERYAMARALDGIAQRLRAAA